MFLSRYAACHKKRAQINSSATIRAKKLLAKMQKDDVKKVGKKL